MRRLPTLASLCLTLILGADAAFAQALAPAPSRDDGAAADLEARIVEILGRFEGRDEAIAKADLPPEALPILERLAYDSEASGFLRIGAIEALGAMPGSAAAEILARIALLGTFDSAQRSAAARAFAHHEGTEALPALESMLVLGGEERRIALEALAVCPAPEAFARLEAELDRSAEVDDQLAVYRARSTWLGEARARGQVPGLVLDARHQPVKDGQRLDLELGLAADADTKEAASVTVTALPLGAARVAGATSRAFALAPGAAPVTTSFAATCPTNDPGFVVVKVELTRASAPAALVAEFVLLR